MTSARGFSPCPALPSRGAPQSGAFAFTNFDVTSPERSILSGFGVFTSASASVPSATCRSFYRQSRALRRLPAGGSRHSQKPVRRHPTKDCRVAVAARDVDCVSIPLWRVRGKPTGEVCLDKGKIGSSRPLRASGARGPEQPAATASCPKRQLEHIFRVADPHMVRRTGVLKVRAVGDDYAA